MDPSKSTFWCLYSRAVLISRCLGKLFGLQICRRILYRCQWCHVPLAGSGRTILIHYGRSRIPRLYSNLACWVFAPFRLSFLCLLPWSLVLVVSVDFCD